MNAIIISIIMAGVLIGGSIMLTKNKSEPTSTGNMDNVTIIDGKQIIEINAKGGYQPRKSTAKAGVPTILRFDTNGTFDCSASMRIPSMNISQVLPNSGSTDIDIGTQQVSTLQGACGMGMYPFEVEFKS